MLPRHQSFPAFVSYTFLGLRTLISTDQDVLTQRRWVL